MPVHAPARPLPEGLAGAITLAGCSSLPDPACGAMLGMGAASGGEGSKPTDFFPPSQGASLLPT